MNDTATPNLIAKHVEQLPALVPIAPALALLQQVAAPEANPQGPTAAQVGPTRATKQQMIQQALAAMLGVTTNPTPRPPPPKTAADPRWKMQMCRYAQAHMCRYQSHSALCSHAHNPSELRQINGTPYATTAAAVMAAPPAATPPAPAQTTAVAVQPTPAPKMHLTILGLPARGGKGKEAAQGFSVEELVKHVSIFETKTANKLQRQITISSSINKLIMWENPDHKQLKAVKEGILVFILNTGPLLKFVEFAKTKERASETNNKKRKLEASPESVEDKKLKEAKLPTPTLIKVTPRSRRRKSWRRRSRT